MGLFNFSQKKKDQPQKPAFSEKRILPRWKINAPAKIKWQDAKDYLACEVRDLNMKGLSLATAGKIPENDLKIELYFNDKYFFNLEASVTWHKEVGGKQIYGIKFSKIRDAEKEKIYQMMNENFTAHLEKY